MKNKIVISIIATVAIFMPFSIVFGQTETIDNKTIISLVKRNLDEDIIISKINTTACVFDVSPESLINLKDNGVSENIIKTMIAKSTSSSKLTGNKEIDDLISKLEESGIYFKDQETGELTKLDATPTTGLKSKAPVTAFGSYKQTLQVAGVRANYSIDKNAVFYLYFESSKNSLNRSKNNDDQSVDGSVFTFLSKNPEAISPNDFLIIKCSVRGKNREFIAGSRSAFGGQSGVSGNQIIDFQYKKIAKNLYKLNFPDGIKAGHYLFYYAGNSQNASNPYLIAPQGNLKVFDFDVINAK
ncbi:MAG: hypothetical protein ACK5CL_02490 [Sphingomonadales bacterium]